MIQELKIKNFLSFKHEVALSFEATKEKALADQHIVEIDGVKLLKLGIVYGANASGKSNLIEAFEFLRHFWFETQKSKEDETGITTFKLDNESEDLPTEFSLIFFVEKRKYVYTLRLNSEAVLYERLDFYPSVQPANVFERKLDGNVSNVTFGPKIKIDQSEKKELTVKCLSNMSVIASYLQINADVEEMEAVSEWMNDQFMPSIGFSTRLLEFTQNLISKNEENKERILTLLQRADFNILDIESEVTKEEITDDFLNQMKVLNFPEKHIEKLEKERTIESIKTTFLHKIELDDGTFLSKPLPINNQSDGTKRVFGLAGALEMTLNNKAFLAIDEIESKLHPKLIEFVIEQFLRESDHAQLLLTTHYDGLLEEDDLLRKDNIWFTEKQPDASTSLYSLAEFKGVNRISSLQKAYKYGRFGAIPNIE